MSDIDPNAHDAPIIHLVRHVLHRDTTLADRVRRLRYRRKRLVVADTPVTDAPEESMNTNDTEITEESTL